VPTRSGSARRYADALFGIAIERGTADQWSEELQRIADLVGDPTAMRVLSSPTVQAQQKRAAIETLASPLSAETLALVNILLQRRRVDLLPSLADAFASRLRESRNVELAEVTTAVDLAEEDRQQVVGWLQGYLGKQVELHHRVDPEILGGIVARVGDRLIDASVRGRLETLRHALSS
jgi:F-type H+-transporting ATPase subunit delta